MIIKYPPDSPECALSEPGAENYGSHNGVYFEAADKGTIFLDEIGELPAVAQVKLLRTLQEGEIVRVGAVNPIQVDVRIIAAGGAVLSAPLPGAGDPNASCDSFTFHGDEITSRAGDAEDRLSVSAVVRYGEFRTMIMGDLTWNKEYELMCPDNTVGTVDAYLVSHHGAETSGSEALVRAVEPRVAIMNNGPLKGGATQTLQSLGALETLDDLWQNHYSVAGGEAYNSPERFIANLEDGSTDDREAPGTLPVHMGVAHWIKISAYSDGRFTVTNSRNGYSKSYADKN